MNLSILIPRDLEMVRFPRFIFWGALDGGFGYCFCKVLSQMGGNALILDLSTVSNMMNKLSGQPDSYDKKCVNLLPFAHEAYSRMIQISISIWSDAGCRDVRHRQGSRMRRRKICHQDHSEEERERE